MMIDFTRMDDEALRDLLTAVNKEFNNRREQVRGNYLFRLQALINDIQDDGFDVEIFGDPVVASDLEIVDYVNGEGGE